MIKRLCLVTLSLMVLLVLGLCFILNDRPDLSALEIPFAGETPNSTSNNNGEVTVTYLGVTSLLFDDGETQILIDGFVSRPPLWRIISQQPIAPDDAAIDNLIDRFSLNRLAAVIPLHSHYDHALDAAEIAKRSGALIVGSQSTAQLARGADVDEQQIILPSPNSKLKLGLFSVQLLESPHAPITGRIHKAIAGEINTPLVPPAPFTAWKEGGCFILLLEHRQLRIMVQSSAGIADEGIAGHQADVLFLGIGGLAGLGEDYAKRYWQTYVDGLGAKKVFPIHFDDFITQSFGTIKAPPRILDDVSVSLGWLKSYAQSSAVRLEQLPFGEALPVATGQ